MANFVNTFRRNVGRVVCEFGRGMESAGNIMMLKVHEDVTTAQSIQKIGDLVPKIGSQAFIAPNARVVGYPEIGPNAYVGYGATVRADINDVKLGKSVYIGDKATIHSTRDALNSEGYQTLIGNHAVVGANSVVIGATLEDNSFIDVSCTIGEGAVVGQYAVVGPGSVVLGDSRIKKGEYWAGNPASFVRQLKDSEIALYEQKANSMMEQVERLRQAHTTPSQTTQSNLRE